MYENTKRAEKEFEFHVAEMILSMVEQREINKEKGILIDRRTKMALYHNLIGVLSFLMFNKYISLETYRKLGNKTLAFLTYNNYN